jgi:hypothetical protein
VIAPTPLLAGRFLSARYAGLRGLGNEGTCPDIAPFLDPEMPGRCTNVNPAAAGRANSSGIVPTVSNQGIVDANSNLRFGMHSTADRAAVEALAREAEAQGRSVGHAVSCEIIPSLGPGTTFFYTDCSIDGGPGGEASNMLQPGYWTRRRDTMALNVAMGYGPQGCLDSAAPGCSGGSLRPTVTAATTPNAPATQPTMPRPTPASAGSTLEPGALLPSAVNGGLPTWALLVAVGVAAFVFLGGKR